MKKIDGYEKTMEAIHNTKNLPIEEAVETLIHCAKKGYPIASARAVQELALLNSPVVVPYLTELYDWLEERPHERDRACDIRITIVECLGEIGSMRGVDTLRKAIRTVQIAKLGPSPEDVAIGLRATAALALASVDADCLYDLAILLHDEEPAIPVSPVSRPFVKASTRSAAAKAIGALGGAGGAAILAVKLKFPNDEVPEVLAECLESLIAMKPEYIMEIAKPYLMGENEFLCAITALALAENFGVEVLELLCEAIDKVGGEAKEGIVVAISVMKGSSIHQLLQDFLGHPDPHVRKGAKKGLDLNRK